LDLQRPQYLPHCWAYVAVVAPSEFYTNTYCKFNSALTSVIGGLKLHKAKGYMVKGTPLLSEKNLSGYHSEDFLRGFLTITTNVQILSERAVKKKFQNLFTQILLAC
jgi:hypothetical protein